MICSLGMAVFLNSSAWLLMISTVKSNCSSSLSSSTNSELDTGFLELMMATALPCSKTLDNNGKNSSDKTPIFCTLRVATPMNLDNTGPNLPEQILERFKKATVGSSPTSAVVCSRAMTSKRFLTATPTQLDLPLSMSAKPAKESITPTERQLNGATDKSSLIKVLMSLEIATGSMKAKVAMALVAAENKPDLWTASGQVSRRETISLKIKVSLVLTM
ncbi:hypothetical protein WICPIJ_010084 [Wickerhamomyces pijperi]|uniref:Secreted protein n=1 Tax=Wickerhamomyces pijperi TaxID=599730 RepID=A0A9P8PI35_WICPI|nr:hypothetical protein WICPIJ_010084 [Wickerhamomyces pijperi]